MYRLTLTIAATLAAATALTAPASATTPVLIPGTSTYTFMTAIGGNFTDSTIFSGLVNGSSFDLEFGGTSTAAFTNLLATYAGQNITLTNNGRGFSGSFLSTATGNNTLVVSGTTTGGTGALTGSLTVLAAAVPEASTWAMMTLGFGALGYALRRRRVDFAFA